MIFALAIAKWKLKLNNKFLNISYYYCMTIFAQIIGVKNIITGNSLGIISKKVEPDNIESVINVIKEMNLI